MPLPNLKVCQARIGDDKAKFAQPTGAPCSKAQLKGDMAALGAEVVKTFVPSCDGCLLGSASHGLLPWYGILLGALLGWLASYVRRPELSYELMQLLDDEEAEEGKNGEDAPDDTNGK